MAQGVPKGMTFVSSTDSTLSVDYLSMYAHMWVICKEIAKREHLLIHKKNRTMRSVLAVFFHNHNYHINHLLVRNTQNASTSLGLRSDIGELKGHNK